MKKGMALAAALLLALAATGPAQANNRNLKPDAVVRNLYAAQKAGAGPFFQTKSRALVDRYFTKDFADLIWKDAVRSKGEVGAFDFDPLYYAQDTKITAFRIGRPQYGEGNLKLADVPVTFRNMGKEVTVLFRLLEGTRGVWKISDIYYPQPNGETLKTILSKA